MAAAEEELDLFSSEMYGKIRILEREMTVRGAVFSSLDKN
jgi:hypothetical protein